MRLKTTRSNNQPEVVANIYLDTVPQVAGSLVKLRTKYATENSIMAAMQCTLKEDIKAHKYGTSPANKHIEG